MQLVGHRWKPGAIGRQPAGALLPFAAAIALGLIVALLPLPLAAAGIAVVAGLLLILRHPWLAVALMLLAGPWGALENVLLGSTFLDSGQLSFLLLGALWLARGVLRRRRYRPGASRGL